MNIPFTWYAIAVLVLTNAVTGVLWRFEAHEVSMLELASEVAAKDAKRIKEEQERINDETVTGWKAALDVTRADFARRLRIANVQPMPGISGPAGGVDGLPADALAIAANCAETTLMLRDLQAWARKQGKVQ